MDNTYLEKAFIVALTDMILAEKRLEALNFVTAGARKNYTYDDKSPLSLETAYQTLSQEIYRAKSDAQSRVMQFGMIVGGEALQTARRLTFTKYLEHNYNIMGFLHTGGKWTGGYDGREHDAFVAEIRAALDCAEDHDHSDSKCMAPERQKEVERLTAALDAAAKREKRLEEVIGEFAGPVLERLEGIGEK